MRIGIVSYRFPPYNAIGAVAVGKTAKYLDRMGHDVRVLTAADQPLEGSLPLEIDPSNVMATRWANVSFLPEIALGGREKVTKTGFTAGGWKGAILKPLGRVYRNTVQVPDPQVGWYPYAVAAGRRLFQEWRPDVLFASAGPYTSLLVAARLSRSLRVPWVGSLRDLWMDNPYRELPRARAVLEDRLERRTLSSARGLVTVSEPLAERLRAKYEVPVAVVSNGFDPEDLVSSAGLPGGAGPVGPLVVTYTGTLIEDRRDPTALFRAVKRLGLGPDDIRVRFVGRYVEPALTWADREGVRDVVEVGAPVAYLDSLAMQRQSDVLLLLAWDDPREQGVVPAKIFEYLGSRRPVLSIGHTGGVPGRLLRERGAGLATNDVDDVVDALRGWLEQKRAGGVPDVPASQLSDLTRRAQTERLGAFLEQVAGS